MPKEIPLVFLNNMQLLFKKNYVGPHENNAHGDQRQAIFLPYPQIPYHLIFVGRLRRIHHFRRISLKILSLRSYCSSYRIILNISPGLIDIYKHILGALYSGGLYSGDLYPEGILCQCLHIKTSKSIIISTIMKYRYYRQNRYFFELKSSLFFF